MMGIGDAIAAYRRAVDPRDVFTNRKVVDEQARFEVVGGVEDDGGIGEQVARVLGIEVGDVGFDVDG